MGNVSEMRVMMYVRQSELETKSRAKVSRIFQRFGLRKPVMKNPVKSIGRIIQEIRSQRFSAGVGTLK